MQPEKEKYCAVKTENFGGGTMKYRELLEQYQKNLLDEGKKKTNRGGY